MLPQTHAWNYSWNTISLLRGCVLTQVFCSYYLRHQCPCFNVFVEREKILWKTAYQYSWSDYFSRCRQHSTSLEYVKCLDRETTYQIRKVKKCRKLSLYKRAINLVNIDFWELKNEFTMKAGCKENFSLNWLKSLRIEKETFLGSS